MHKRSQRGGSLRASVCKVWMVFNESLRKHWLKHQSAILTTEANDYVFCQIFGQPKNGNKNTQNTARHSIARIVKCERYLIKAFPHIAWSVCVCECYSKQIIFYPFSVCGLQRGPLLACEPVLASNVQVNDFVSNRVISITRPKSIDFTHFGY